ncbi:MAG: hypothetical protein CVU05_05755 [Bacteroidetes bacterium HGW-Bacteroidetes-21]|jgi:hypothetical protein|nr:MAG: hypothetical protein CVU05_05755 [Bacteroidetes bacterium HGW-Bacteroidetes-21]
MKLPSGKYLSRKTMNTLYRFPVSIGLSFIATILLFIITEKSYLYNDSPWLFKSLFAIIQGIPFFVAIQLLSERLEVQTKLRNLFYLAGLGFILLYFFSLPDNDHTQIYIRFAVFLFMNILLILLAPYIGIRQNNGFWKYGNMLLTRFLRTALYGMILFIAVALALVAIDELFDVDIDGKRYAQLWIIITVFFGTWFFLSALPKYFEKLNANLEYSNTLRIFVQFILIPIVILYTLILYAYFVKVIVMWDWPHGWVSSLIMGYSVLTIFTFLVVYPIRTSQINTYVRFFVGFFPYILWPLIAILFLSLFKRVSDYGFTENRYFVMIMGFWLLFIMTYLLMKRFRDIKMIPASLAVLAFLSVVGPWSAFQVSKYSQLMRFENILNKYEKLTNGIYNPNEKKIEFGDYNELVAETNFILENYGHEPFKEYFNVNIDTLEWDSVKVWRYSSTNPIIDHLLIECLSDSNSLYGDSLVYLTVGESSLNNLVDISGYNYYLPFNAYFNTYPDTSKIFYVEKNLNENEKFSVQVKTDTALIVFSLNDSIIETVKVGNLISSIPFQIKRDSSYMVPSGYMKVTTDNNRFLAQTFFRVIYGNFDGKNLTNASQLDGYLLIKLK